MLDYRIASFSLPLEGRGNSDVIATSAVEGGGVVAAIADGVGSASHGGQAARLAVETCMELADVTNLESIFSQVSARIKAESSRQNGQWSSTLSVCRLKNGFAEVGHVGDTRIYQLRGLGLQTRTRDQTEVERLVEQGVLTRERAKRYPRRNVLLSSLNGSDDYELQITGFETLPGDRILLLSDGVYNQVTKGEIATLSQENLEVTEFVEALKSRLVTYGLVDDSSALCVELRDRQE